MKPHRCPPRMGWIRGRASINVPHELTSRIDLLGAQRPESLAKAAFLTWPAANGPQHPASTGRAYDLQLHATLVLGDLLPKLANADICHNQVCALSDERAMRCPLAVW